MGDRANFGFRHTNETKDTVFVYGHWAGNDMLARFALALKTMKDYGRIEDDAYGTRIGVQALLADAYSPDAGWGITVNYLADNEHKVPVFDFGTQKVTLYDMGGSCNFNHPLVSYNVDRFIDKYAK